jgi:hypothetical protein
MMNYELKVKRQKIKDETLATKHTKYTKNKNSKGFLVCFVCLVARDFDFSF